MLTALVLLLFLAAALLLALRRPALGGSVLVAALALFWLGGSGMLAERLLEPLESPYARLLKPRWSARNAIVLLGAGASKRPDGNLQPSLLGYSRIMEAVRLYLSCRASGAPCTLIISGGDPGAVGASEAAVYRAEALGLGVPAADLALEDRSLNTFQNAEFASAMLRAGGYDRVLLVTSAVHMTRSLLYFTHFGSRCDPAVADQAQPARSWIPVGYNLALADMAVHEYAGILRYRFYNLLGLNQKAAARAGAV